jgi:hypothetical protein
MTLDCLRAAPMNTNFKRRVERNTVLKYQNALSPLFEAVMNCIDAIRERGNGKGKISITIERDDSQANLQGDEHPDVYPVKSFRVIDNGIGMTVAHYDAFGMADTDFKHDSGGKGLGRLLWLKAFDHAEIKSTFIGEDGKRYSRSFEFRLTKNGIEDHQVRSVNSNSPTGTEVRLCAYRSEYAKQVPRSAKAISVRVIEHFLQYFVLEQMPDIALNDAGDVIDLQEMFAGEVDSGTRSRASFSVGDEEFVLAHFLVRPTFQAAHRLYFCSDRQMVTSKPLTGKIPNLAGSIHYDGKSLTYAGYLSGSYLDGCSNGERTAFDISDEDSPYGPGWDAIVSGAIAEASRFLDPFTKPLKQLKEERIKAFTHKTAPQYRPVVKHRPDLVDKIPSNVSDETLDQELYKINQIYESDLRDRSTQILASLRSGPGDWEQFSKRYGEFLDEWNEAGIAKLARHVVHRKATIDFFKASVQRIPDSDKYNLEDAIHRLIFPLQSTSDDLPPDKMNLWMVDEKLSYHYYLASNLTFNQQEIVDLASGKKPDVIIYNNPAVLVNEAQPFSSVTILEFKRPLRNDYTDEDNPIAQVFEYTEKLKSGRALDRRGTPIQIRPDTPIYAYILCDPSLSLAKQARFYGLQQSPDGLGYFGYNSEVGVWVEVVTFTKLISDAEKRNMALFDQLNIPRQP